jgi:hypothetical protein
MPQLPTTNDPNPNLYKMSAQILPKMQQKAMLHLQSQQRQNLRQKTKLLQPSRLPVGDQARK